MYFLIKDSQVLEYPLTIDKLKIRFPNISIPKIIINFDYDGYTVLEGIANYPTCNKVFYEVTQDPGILVDGVPTGQYTISEKDEFEIKDALKESVVALREQKETEGVLFHFSDSDSDGTIQIRNATDLRNIQGIVSTALVLTISSNSTPLHFKDEENVEHTITAAEAMGLGVAVSAHIHALYARMWALKEGIDACITFEELQAIDINVGWPE